MKTYKKFLLLIILILILIFVFFLIQIFAKYLTSASGDTAMTVARWNILVNNISIKNNSDLSNTLTPVFPGNENIASNIIAPTAEGYFDLNFDFSAADVSFDYEITTTVDENSSVKDLVTTGYSIDDGDKIIFDEVNLPIKNTILLSDNTKTQKVRVYVKWIDDSSATMNNVEDTTATTSGNPALLHVNISFTQIAEAVLQ